MYTSSLPVWLACFIVLTPLASAQTDKVKISMAALKAETGKLGAPKVEVNNLYFGKTKVSNDLVDAVVKAQNGVATLFGKNGKEVKRRTVRARWNLSGCLKGAPCKRAC